MLSVGLSKWEEENNAKFNAEKFVLLRYNKKPETDASYEINGIKIKEFQNTRDVGVIVNNKGTPEDHIDNVTKQCSRMILEHLLQEKRNPC